MQSRIGSLAKVTSLVAIVAVWALLVPLWYIVYQMPPEETISSYERFDAKLSPGIALVLRLLATKAPYVLALVVSVLIIGVGIRARRKVELLAGQVALLGAWCVLLAATLLVFFLPMFTMHELVMGAYAGPKSEFTQIQFLTDSFPPRTYALFMQRDGQEERIGGAEGEVWGNVAVAAGTNTAFVVVRTQVAQSTNKPSYWHPARVVRIDLPLTNEPLSDYSLRTLFTCKSRDDLVPGDLVPSHLTTAWGDRHLVVHCRVKSGQTNALGMTSVACIYDIEQNRFLGNPPLALAARTTDPAPSR